MVTFIVEISWWLTIAAIVYIFGTTTVRKLNHPEKSYKYCLLNTFLGLFRLLRLGLYKHGDRIRIDDCVKQAMYLTKLNDFGDVDFIQLYRQIQNSNFHSKQILTNVGYIAAYQDLVTMLCGRLKKIKYIKDNPALLKVPIKCPIFIFGLPRSGTTFLHRLLSLDTSSRAPLLWELVNSAPLVPPNATFEEKLKCFQKRRDLVHKTLKYREYIGDESLTHIHEIHADLPEECLMTMREEIPLNLQNLCSIYMQYEEDVQSYLQRNINGILKAYEYYRKTLQMLSFQRGDIENPRRWILKCPFHLIFIDQIKSVFPDAKLIWSHRHPVSAVPSLCSLLKGCHQTYFEDCNRNDSELGRSVCKASETWLSTAPQSIQQSGLPCVNIIYDNLVRDPVQTVRDIYKFFDMDFTVEYENQIRCYLQENSKERESMKTKHIYDPSVYGLTTNELSEGIFKAYIDTYDIPFSSN